MITQRFEFARMRELVVASDDSNSFEYGRERSHGRFEFVRTRKGEIVCDDLNSLECGSF